MYLPIGNGATVNTKRVIGIFDLDTATVCVQTRKFIKKKERAGIIEYRDTDIPRSFVLYTDTNGRERIQLSRITSTSLLGRAERGIHAISDDD